MDESQGFSKRTRGDRAKAIMEDPTFQEALTTIRDNIHAKWESSPISDDDTLLRLKYSIDTLRSIELQLNEFIYEGSVDRLEEELENKRKERE